MTELDTARERSSPESVGIVVSVGVSMLDSFSRWLEQRSDTAVHEREGIVASLRRGTAELPLFVRQFEDNLGAMAADASQLKYPCGELQTLGVFFAVNRHLKAWTKRVTLFHTRGEEGAACAHALRRLLSEGDVAKYLLGGPAEVGLEEFDLNLAEQDRFAVDVVHLMTRIREEVRHYRRQGCKRMLVCATGGYKALTPFMSLLGFLDGEEVLYSYETSNSVLTVPQLPLAWDMRFLDEFRTCILGGELSAAAYETLPPKFKPFFMAQPRGGTGELTHAKSPFGEMLAADYQQRRHLRFGWGQPLLSRFTSEDCRHKLEALIQGPWDHLWLGDQIPETVEHARGHSTRLMELARDLIDLTGVGLTDDELFALIAAIWLHDIGHSALEAEAVRVGEERFPLFLFPSLVRELHHVLSAELITGLGDLARDTLATVSLMAEYHRRSTPLVDRRQRWANDLFGLQLYPLCARAEDSSVEGVHLAPERLVLLVALLRFVDACDVQADRVIGRHYLNARRERTRVEIAVYLGRLERVASALAREAGRAAQLGEIVRAVRGAVESWEESNEAHEARKNLRLRILNRARQAIAEGACPGYLMALGMADSILFKRGQEAHFLKHAGIECVYLGPGTGGEVTGGKAQRGRLRVYLMAHDEEDRAGGCRGSKGEESVRSRVTKVAEEIWEEYGAARAVLDPFFTLEGVFWNDGKDVVRVCPASCAREGEGVSQCR